MFDQLMSGRDFQMDRLPDTILREFRRLEKGVQRQELQRAKVQLKSQLMMNLEMRPVMFEDLGRQVLAHDERRMPHYYAEKIGESELRHFTQGLCKYGVVDLCAR